MRKINSYNFQRISSIMGNEFGKIEKGGEEKYNLILFPMEGNILKIARQNPKCNGRRAIEAINICLFKIHGRLNEVEYDLSEYITPENEPLVNALLMSFDPFANELIFKAVKQEYDLQSVSELQEYYETPIKCLLRIETSIETWTKQHGASGYFDFLEKYIGMSVAADSEMNFTVALRGEK